MLSNDFFKTIFAKCNCISKETERLKTKVFRQRKKHFSSHMPAQCPKGNVVKESLPQCSHRWGCMVDCYLPWCATRWQTIVHHGIYRTIENKRMSHTLAVLLTQNFKYLCQSIVTFVFHCVLCRRLSCHSIIPILQEGMYVLLGPWGSEKVTPKANGTKSLITQVLRRIIPQCNLKKNDNLLLNFVKAISTRNYTCIFALTFICRC